MSLDLVFERTIVGGLAQGSRVSDSLLYTYIIPLVASPVIVSSFLPPIPNVFPLLSKKDRINPQVWLHHRALP
ncbi:hypothetical protein M434DRAFT_368203 [Hypoxylon sp. CO27-5]|nr:hypothetical protein M434DRAFT_368203 [Hypoxylon sp. CO27-5]